MENCWIFFFCKSWFTRLCIEYRLYSEKFYTGVKIFLVITRWIFLLKWCTSVYISAPYLSTLANASSPYANNVPYSKLLPRIKLSLQSRHYKELAAGVFLKLWRQSTGSYSTDRIELGWSKVLYLNIFPGNLADQF